MKTSFLVIFLSAWCFLPAQEVLKGYVLTEKGQPLSGILLHCPQLNNSEITTNARGGFELATPSNVLKPYDEILFTVHNDEYLVAATEENGEVRSNPQQNSFSVTLLGRKKGVVNVRMKGKELIVPLTTARITPETTQSVAIQVAAMKNDLPETEKYYEEQLKMDVQKHYNGDKVVYAVHVPNAELANVTKESINAKKIKGIDRAFVVAIENLDAPIVYRLQLAATANPIDIKTKEQWSQKLATLKTAWTEAVSEDSVLKFRYYTTDFFGDEQKAKLLGQKLKKHGISAFVVAFKQESKRL